MAAGLKIDNLNRRVVILRRGPSIDDGYQTRPGDWQPAGFRFASVKPALRREGIEAAGREGRQVQSVWLHYDDLSRTLTTGDAIELDGVHHEIVAAPIEIGLRRGIEVLAVAGGQPVEASA